jgi:hypothetical protein
LLVFCRRNSNDTGLTKATSAHQKIAITSRFPKSKNFLTDEKAFGKIGNFYAE